MVDSPVTGQYQQIVNFADTVTISGKVFQALNNSKMPLGGGLFNPVIPYTMVRYPGNTVYRTCVITGQNDSFQGDTVNMVRAELYGPPITFGTPAYFDFDFFVGPQSPTEVTTLTWFIIFQIHASNNVSGASPPISFDILPDGEGGEKLQIDWNYNSGDGNVFDNLGSIPLVRNVWHHAHIAYIDGNGTATGAVNILIDEEVVCDETDIVTGYISATSGSYPKFGIYAGTTYPTPMTAGINLWTCHKNLNFNYS